MSTTPFMGLLLPVPTVTVGPLYATELVTAFDGIDAHDHTSGKGVPVPAAGLNINANLPFGGFSATGLKTTAFNDQGSSLSSATVGALYIAGGNLYYNNGAGTAVQITAGGALNAASIGGIGGDYVGSGASVFYTSATSTFTFWQAANQAARMDVGRVTIRRDTVTSAPGITLLSPALAGSYNLTLPNALPLIGSFLVIDISGNMSYVSLDGTTLINTASVISVGVIGNANLAANSVNTTQIVAGAVTNAKMATNSITTANIIDFNVTDTKLSINSVNTAKIQDHNVTQIKLGTANFALGSFVSSAGTSGTSFVALAGMTATITSTGRPLVITAVSGSAASPGALQISSTSGAGIGQVGVSIDGGSTFLGIHEIQLDTSLAGAVFSISSVPLPSVMFFAGLSSGTYTIALYAKVNAAPATVNVINAKLLVYEL